MPAQYPASIILTNFGNGTDQYQKTVEIDFPAGPAYVEPGAHQQITLDAARPSIVLRVGRWADRVPRRGSPTRARHAVLLHQPCSELARGLVRRPRGSRPHRQPHADEHRLQRPG
jgi:hypothetical protein